NYAINVPTGDFPSLNPELIDQSLLPLLSLTEDSKISRENLTQLCPQILYMIDNSECYSNSYIKRRSQIVEDQRSKSINDIKKKPSTGEGQFPFNILHLHYITY